MANTRTSRAGKPAFAAGKQLSIDIERKKVRALQINLGSFALVLLTILSMAMSPGVKSFASLV